MSHNITAVTLSIVLLFARVLEQFPEFLTLMNESLVTLPYPSLALPCRPDSARFDLPLCMQCNAMKTVVVGEISLSGLKKLKFRRGASMTVILKNGDAKEFLTAQVI